MKSVLFVLAFLMPFSDGLHAQYSEKAVSPSIEVVSYDLGGRAVRIPPPDRFTDTVTSFPRIAGRLIAAESPLNEVLAVHVTDELLPDIRIGLEPDLPLYTKVSVLKQLRAVDVETAEFDLLVVQFEKQSPGVLKAIVRSNEKGAGERLSRHWGKESGLKIGETQMLGYFNKQPRSISSMFLMETEIFRRKKLVLGSMSLLHINKRVLFLYVFRVPTAVSDQQDVADLTRNWIAKTVAANK